MESVTSQQRERAKLAQIFLGFNVAVAVAMLIFGSTSPEMTWFGMFVMATCAATSAFFAFRAGRPLFGLLGVLVALGSAPLVISLAFLLGGP
ncbi:hypothetical protein [Luteococcus sp. OSA5]|uniref:hypothetical protein n=1 Tax=Luteococcus sp. OSA5 TaxID=3401630 RepID=UPI003B42BA2D